MASTEFMLATEFVAQFQDSKAIINGKVGELCISLCSPQQVGQSTVRISLLFREGFFRKKKAYIITGSIVEATMVGCTLQKRNSHGNFDVTSVHLVRS